jgi:TRAP transporter TAXI family solute receptor
VARTGSQHFLETLKRGKIMLKRVITAVAVVAVLSFPGTALAQKDIRWGTSAVGSVGHKALVVLANFLNKEMPNYRISVLPTPGAIVTIKGYATGEYEGTYGSDIAFYELANDINRFKGFKDKIKRQPMQSFWSNTIEVSLAVHARNKDKYKKWGDLAGKRIFTGPLPFDVRAHLERALAALDVKFTYVQLDLSAAGAQLESGAIDAMNIYTGAEKAPPPWLAEASLATDWAALNPSPDEIAKLKQKGFSVVELSPDVFKRNVHVPKVVELPFYYGFHLGVDVPADDVYKMLKLIEANAAELAKADPTFSQIAADFVGFQKRGIAAAVDFVPIHPGLAKFMREKGAWDKKWDSKIATM